jgi:hypothetical protein
MMVAKPNIGKSCHGQSLSSWRVLLWTGGLGVSLLVTAQLPPKTGIDFIQHYCVDCHQAPKPKAKLDLSDYRSIDRIVEDALDWDQHLARVREGDMPPDDEDVLQPSTEERSDFVSWLEASLREAACSDGITPGPAMIRRLNQSEYSASVRHLLDIHFDAGEALPSDGAGGEGFDNAAETLFISPIHAEKYLEAARTAVEYGFSDTRSNRRFLIARPDEETTPQEAATQILEKFLPRAFRRPVNDDEFQEYFRLFEIVYEKESSFSVALKLTLSAVLVSPKFLFIIEAPNNSPAPVPITDPELATRLAYFLWGSSPDDELQSLANSNELHEPETLKAQVNRMLEKRNSRKARNFAQVFIEQWLGTRALGREFKPDKSVKGYDSELEGGMKYEPVFFFHEILTKNRSLLDIIDADYTYANRRLARHYKIKGEFREQPKRIEIKDQPHRGGFLSMAAVLAISSHPQRTSPVLRGKWILETLIGEAPPPPPPNVPELEDDGEAATAQSLRERLEIHRENPTCATCHDRIDPLGFSLENYDVLGRWREEEGGHPIDASATLPDGTAFSGPEELKLVLLDRKDQIVRHLTKKMLGYALARGLTFEDYCTVENIVDSLRENDYQSHSLLMGIINSVPFRYKAGTDRSAGVYPIDIQKETNSHE